MMTNDHDKVCVWWRVTKLCASELGLLFLISPFSDPTYTFVLDLRWYLPWFSTLVRFQWISAVCGGRAGDCWTISWDRSFIYSRRNVTSQFHSHISPCAQSTTWQISIDTSQSVKFEKSIIVVKEKLFKKIKCFGELPLVNCLRTMRFTSLREVGGYISSKQR